MRLDRLSLKYTLEGIRDSMPWENPYREDGGRPLRDAGGRAAEPEQASRPFSPDGFASVFAEAVKYDVRTKPSYTDCWVMAPSKDMQVASRYNTGYCDVAVGMAMDGEMEYDATPVEYTYSDGMNALVLSVISGIRKAFRDSGGRLDRDTVMGMARSSLAEAYDTVSKECPDDMDLDGFINGACGVCYRHSVGAGIFEVLLADDRIEDVYIDAPCTSNRIYVTMNGVDGVNSHMRCRTNLMTDRKEVLNLVNILKRDSGLRFGYANPVLETDFSGYDARATVIGYPMSPNGEAVAIRRHSSRPWTLSRLIANGTIDERTAGMLSFLVNNRSTILVCGARGAGKSSMLTALMMEFDPAQRILTIEDTIELPGEAMRRMGYKVQSMLVDDRMGGEQASRSNEALRVSLRMGESAIVLGEVRGEEARTLYESMRVGRAGSSIMGTIHGDSADSVYRRVVDDMGVAPEAFMATDIVVTLGTVKDRRTGHLVRRMNEMMATGREPGEFMDVTDDDSFFSSPYMVRAMGTSQMNRSEIEGDILARGRMRGMLAEAGRRDERFLGSRWIMAANDLSSKRAGRQPEQVLAEFKARMDSETRAL